MKKKIYNSEETSEESIIKMMIKESANDKKPIRRHKKVTESDIRKRALEIYEERLNKGISGDADTDWVQAEDELKGKHI